MIGSQIKDIKKEKFLGVVFCLVLITLGFFIQINIFTFEKSRYSYFQSTSRHFEECLERLK